MSQLVITSAGLDAVLNASLPQYSLKYFLPIYDQRIDTSIHNNPGDGTAADALALSASITSSDTDDSIIGERLWNLSTTTSAYSITEDDYFLYVLPSTTVTEATGLVLGTTQTQPSRINYIRDTTIGSSFVPLTTITSGTVVPSVCALGDYKYSAYPIATVTSAGNITATVDRNYLWTGVTYSPEATALGTGSNVVACFKARIPNGSGNFKFNKMAIYIQKLYSTGAIDYTYTPILFAQAALNKTVEISNTGQSLSNFELDVKLDFTQGGSNSIVFNTDYWTRIPAQNNTPNGLFFGGDVALGTSGVPSGSWYPRAHLEITDSDKAQLRLTRIYSNKSSIFETKDSGVLNINTSGNDPSTGDPLLELGYLVSATASKSIAMGQGCLASERLAFAMGLNTSAVAPASVALGNTTITLGNNSLAMGHSTVAGESGERNAVAFGYQTSALGYNSFGTGDSNRVYSDNSFIIGGKSNRIEEGCLNSGIIASSACQVVDSNYVLLLGKGIIADTAQNSMAIGRINNSSSGKTQINGTNSLLVGDDATLNGNNCLVIARNKSYIAANSDNWNNILFGNNVTIMGRQNFLFGRASKIDSTTTSGCVLFSDESTLGGDTQNAFGFGRSLNIYSSDSYVIGRNSSIEESSPGSSIFGGNNHEITDATLTDPNGLNLNNIIIGGDNSSISDYSVNNGIIAGRDSIITRSTNNIVLGGNYNQIGNADWDVMDSVVLGGEGNTILRDSSSGSISRIGILGSYNNVYSSNSFAIGSSNIIGDSSLQGFAIGESNIIEGEDGIAIGFGNHNKTSIGTGSILIGATNVGNSGDGSIAIGTNNIIAGDTSVLIGNSVKSESSNSFYMGNQGRVYNTNSLAIGNSLDSGGDKSVVIGHYAFGSGDRSVTIAASNRSVSNAANDSIKMVSETLSSHVFGNRVEYGENWNLQSTTGFRHTPMNPNLYGDQCFYLNDEVTLTTSADTVNTTISSTLYTIMSFNVMIQEDSGTNWYLPNSGGVNNFSCHVNDDTGSSDLWQLIFLQDGTNVNATPKTARYSIIYKLT